MIWTVDTFRNIFNQSANINTYKAPYFRVIRFRGAEIRR